MANDASSYVKEGAGRGAATILPDFNAAALMSAAANQAAKMQQIKAVKDKQDEAQFNKILTFQGEGWDEDRPFLRQFREGVSSKAINAMTEYGSWNNVPLDLQDEIMNGVKTYKEYSKSSQQYRQIWAQAFQTLAADKGQNFDLEASYANLQKFIKGGEGVEDIEGLFNGRSKIVKENLLVPKEKPFDWIGNAQKLIGDIKEKIVGGTYEQGGKRISFSKTATDADNFMQVAEAVIVAEPQILKTVAQNMADAPALSEKFNNKEAMPEEVRSAFKADNPAYNYYLTTMWNKQERKSQNFSTTTMGGGGGGFGGDNLVEIGNPGKINVSIVEEGGTKRDYTFDADKAVMFKESPQGTFNFTTAFDPVSGRIMPFNAANYKNSKVIAVYQGTYNGRKILVVNVETHLGTLLVPYATEAGGLQPEFEKLGLHDEIMNIFGGTQKKTTPSKQPTTPSKQGNKTATKSQFNL